ncbi:hypothetical protein DPEC_G00339620 [Dallia pectoralis]|uniref:Uncharacterized protein n=1 Tax=Dallia pectoralis TaxID=75939 RepID=A0ACC2F4Z7_DALPE|nr:hypothetical protein DPEC_G00339620 [Dallia pectoralis]
MSSSGVCSFLSDQSTGLLGSCFAKTSGGRIKWVCGPSLDPKAVEQHGEYFTALHSQAHHPNHGDRCPPPPKRPIKRPHSPRYLQTPQRLCNRMFRYHGYDTPPYPFYCFLLARFLSEPSETCGELLGFGCLTKGIILESDVSVVTKSQYQALAVSATYTKEYLLATSDQSVMG